MKIHEDDDLINYDELYKILFEKFKATHDEIRYWVKNEPQLAPYHSDLPYFFGSDPFYQLAPFIPGQSLCQNYHFYSKHQANEFIPKDDRFVYLKDLTAKRNWYDYKIDDSHSKIIETLKKANEVGILRFYDFDSDKFTIHRTNKPLSSTVNQDKKQFWCHTHDGESYLTNPDSFFHIRDILNIERIFFNRPREDCLTELSQLYGQQIPISYPCSNNIGNKSAFHNYLNGGKDA